MNLSPELETRLASLAEARGTSIESFLRDLVEEKSGQASMRLVDPEEWAREFEAWADSFPDARLSRMKAWRAKALIQTAVDARFS